MENTPAVIYWKSLPLLQASQEAVHSAESFYFFKKPIKIELTLIYKHHNKHLCSLKSALFELHLAKQLTKTLL